MADFSKIVAKLTTDQKIERAEDLTARILDHSLHLLRIHYSNRELNYSDQVSKQIPRSFAAHTFNLLQITQYRFEVMRLSALWDEPREDRESIPTVIEYVQQLEVRDKLQRRYASQWDRDYGFANFLGDDELALDPEFRNSIRRSDIEFGQKEARKSRRCLDIAIEATRRLQNSRKLEALSDFRNTRLAHNLGPSASKVSPENKVKYGDEKHVLDRTLNIVSFLNLGIRGASFQWDDARKTARRYAEAFWSGVTISVRE